MKNKEKYAKEIVELAIKSNGRYVKIAVNKITGEPVACHTLDCKECLFGIRFCSDDDELLNWAEAEYKRADNNGEIE